MVAAHIYYTAKLQETHKEVGVREPKGYSWNEKNQVKVFCKQSLEMNPKDSTTN